MWNKLRHVVTPTVIVILAAYGIAYAATGSPNPASLVSNHGQEHSEDVKGVSDPSDSSESSDDAADPVKPPKASHEPKTRSSEGCPEGFTGNHGQFVSQSEDHHAAAKSDCGKPVHPEKSADVSPTTSDDGQQSAEVEHGDDKKPEPSGSPDADANGDQHSNDHQGNADSHGTDG